MISDATNARLGPEIQTEAIGEVTVKGRGQAIKIFKVVGMAAKT